MNGENIFTINRSVVLTRFPCRLAMTGLWEREAAERTDEGKMMRGKKNQYLILSLDEMEKCIIPGIFS